MTKPLNVVHIDILYRQVSVYSNKTVKKDRGYSNLLDLLFSPFASVDAVASQW